MSRMQIEDMVDRWNDERPENFISFSSAKKREEFIKFCEWNGFDLTLIVELFITYDV